MKFYDRSGELTLFAKEIKRIREQKKSRFMVITGRRRIGKTALGLKALGQDAAPGIYLFCYPYAVESELAKQWMDDICRKLDLANRYKADTINDIIDAIFDAAKHRRINLFIDEIQDMLSINPGFFGKLREQWDKLTLQGQSHLFMVLSGSAASIVKRLFSDYSQPLYRRMTARMELKAFPPAVVKEIYRDYVKQSDSEGLLSLYALTGGVA